MRTISQGFELRFDYDVVFTRRAFSLDNPVLRDVFARAGAGPHRVLPVLDSGVLQADPSLPARLAAYGEAHPDVIELVSRPLIVRGGERCKSDPREVDEFHALVARHEICRHSFALVIGGGAVLDAIGFAAATAHRGIRCVRMPTTVLAQNDAGIGVKNAINFGGRKNFVGSFAPPFAVVDDFAFLETLPARDLRSGLAEAIKVALIRDRAFFEQLHRDRAPIGAFVPESLEAVIVRCAELHLEHIRQSGDPYELGSTRPLDFGHWAAHKLEEITESWHAGESLRHGEAVAIGIALDSHYSQQAGLISEGELHRIIELLTDLGFELAHPALARIDVERALADFREHLGSELCITLLAGLGRGVEVSEIDAESMRKCIGRLLRA